MSLRDVASTLLAVVLATGASAQTIDRLEDGVALSLDGRRLEVHACRDDIVRVLYAPPGPFSTRPSLVRVAGPAGRRRSR